MKPILLALLATITLACSESATTATADSGGTDVVQDSAIPASDRLDASDTGEDRAPGDAARDATSCPAAADLRAGGACAVDSNVNCFAAEGCHQCFATSWRRYSQQCSCQSGRWLCAHIDCGPRTCDIFTDSSCARFVSCDAGLDAALDAAPDVALDTPGDQPATLTDAAVDGGLCPPGTCIPPTGGGCEPPTGPTGNACCACGPDGRCSSPCRCAAPDTPIATPEGDRPIASLAAGDLVYSFHRGAIRAVALRAVQRLPVHAHRVTRVSLVGGAVLRISAGHPTADGRHFSDLGSGDWLGGRVVESATVIDYPFDATYDILPDSDTGTYLAGGALIGSTMVPETRLGSVPLACVAPLVVTR